jgi:hypothetical protein
MSEDTVATRISALGGDLAPLITSVSRYVRFGTAVNNSTVMVAPMPWRAPQAYAFRLYEPLSPEVELNFDCPDFYRAVLYQMNGCFAFGLSLYGLPTLNGQLNRSTLRPLSLHEANTSWRNEFKGADTTFHFGSAKLSESENVGYFYSDGSILCLRESGAELKRWAKFAAFLNDELARVEVLAHTVPTAASTWHGAQQFIPPDAAR